MDTPGSSQRPKKKRDPETNKRNQKLYRQRQYAAVNGIEKVKTLHRQRYHERMARMKANGEYEAFKAKKVQEGMRRYHAMSEEKRNEVKRKNAQCQKNWMQKMKEEGTYEAYKHRLNVRRRALQAEKKRVLGEEGWKALQKQKYEKRVESIRRQRWEWLDEQLDRPFPLPWLPLDWAGPSLRRIQYKPFVRTRYSKWTTTCKNKNEFIKISVVTIQPCCLFL